MVPFFCKDKSGFLLEFILMKIGTGSTDGGRVTNKKGEKKMGARHR
jgi:hypothetical protein